MMQFGVVADPVEAEGRLVFPSFASEREMRDKFPSAKKDARELSVPDFGRGGETWRVYEREEGWGGREQLMDKWKEGQVQLHPVVAALVSGARGTAALARGVVLATPSVAVAPIRSDTSPPFKHTNLVAIAQGKELLLVDPGGREARETEEALAAMEEALYGQEAKNKPETVRVLVTHRHRDHWAGMRGVANRYKEAEIVGSFFRFGFCEDATQCWTWLLATMLEGCPCTRP